jgi:uncharacterized protein (TIGR02271 family)
MDRDMTNFVPQIGMDVVGADGEKVGEIDAVEQDYFVVRKGFFFPQDHYIPLSAISSFDEDGKVYLNVTKDQALEQEWGNPPAQSTGAVYDRTETVDTTAANYGQGDLTGYAADVDTDYVGDRTVDADYVGDAAAVDTGYVGDRRGVNVDDEGRTIDVHDEELTATTRPVERGAVRVSKDVVEEQQTLDVPVTEEEVEITRRRVNRDVTDADHAFEEGTIEVPLRGEEVNVEKRARVVEEIDIDKTAREHTEQVSGTVRHEEVHVDGDNIDVNSTDRPNRTRTDDDLI